MPKTNQLKYVSTSIIYCSTRFLHRTPTYLCTSIVETSKRIKRSSLGVKRNDVFHDLRVFAPVERLKVVGRHYVNFFLPGHTSKEDDFLRVTGFKQWLHGLWRGEKCLAPDVLWISDGVWVHSAKKKKTLVIWFQSSLDTRCFSLAFDKRVLKLRRSQNTRHSRKKKIIFFCIE